MIFKPFCVGNKATQSNWFTLSSTAPSSTPRALCPNWCRQSSRIWFLPLYRCQAGRRETQGNRGKEERGSQSVIFFWCLFISQLLPSHAWWCAPSPCFRAKRQVNFTASYPSWQRLWQQGGNSARCSQAAAGTCPTAKSLSKQFSIFSFPWVGSSISRS